MNGIILPVVILGGIGLIAALILYLVAKKFAVYEDPHVAEVEAVLPGANCGACGFKGCHDFAVGCCNAKSLDGMRCPGAGESGMKRIATILGLAVEKGKPNIAVLSCYGSRENRLTSRNVVAPASCRLSQTLAFPDDYCLWGCLGCGDCVEACKFGAISIDSATGLPVVIADKCTGCGACVKACPQHILHLRDYDASKPLIYVACSNCAKGALARKMCKAACIGCGKCVRTCQHGAITLKNNVAVIDGSKCIGCGECLAGCPTHAIHNLTQISPTAI